MLTIFYDSHCPLCMAEMTQLKDLDTQKKIKFADLHADDFSTVFPYIDKSKANLILHGELPCGEILLGLDVTCKAWSLVGRHKWLVILRWPVIRFFADIIYRIFARYRNTISYLLTGKKPCKQCSLDKLKY